MLLPVEVSFDLSQAVPVLSRWGDLAADIGAVTMVSGPRASLKPLNGWDRRVAPFFRCAVAASHVAPTPSSRSSVTPAPQSPFERQNIIRARSTQLLVCSIPQAAQFSILEDEVILVSIKQQSLQIPQCKSTITTMETNADGDSGEEIFFTTMFLVVADGSPSGMAMLESATVYFGFGVAVMCLFSVVFGCAGGTFTFFNIQMLAMTGRMTCASATDSAASRLLFVFVSPLHAVSYEATVLSNVGVVAVIWIIFHTVASRRLFTVKEVFLSSSIIAFVLIAYSGVIHALARILARASNTKNSLAIAGIGIIYCSFVAVAVVKMAISARSASSLSFVRYGPLQSHSRSSAASRWLSPLGFWLPESAFQKCWVFLSPVRDVRPLLCLYQPGIATIISILAAIPVDGDLPPVPQCGRLAGSISGLFFVGALFVLWIQPHRARAMNVFSGVSLLLLAARVALQGVSATSPQEEQPMFERFVFYGILIFSFFQAAYDICLAQCERFLWTLHRDKHQRTFSELLLSEALLNFPEGFGDSHSAAQSPTETSSRSGRRRRRKQTPELGSTPGAVSLGMASPQVDEDDNESLISSASSDRNVARSERSLGGEGHHDPAAAAPDGCLSKSMVDLCEVNECHRVNQSGEQLLHSGVSGSSSVCSMPSYMEDL